MEYDKRLRKWEATVYSEELTILGIHTCDIAGLQCLNMVFLDPMDANYNIRKKKIMLIGLECNDYCDAYASCGLMDTYLPNGGYDMFMTDLGDRFHHPRGDAVGRGNGRQTQNACRSGRQGNGGACCLA